MFITNCFAYDDIEADLRQCNEIFILALKDPSDNAMHLSLSYSQVKLLAEGMLIMLAQVCVKELIDSEYNHLTGGMGVKISLLEQSASDEEEGEETICQQPSLSVPMEPVSLSKIA